MWKYIPSKAVTMKVTQWLVDLPSSTQRFCWTSLEIIDAFCWQAAYKCNSTLKISWSAKRELRESKAECIINFHPAHIIHKLILTQTELRSWSISLGGRTVVWKISDLIIGVTRSSAGSIIDESNASSSLKVASWVSEAGSSFSESVDSSDGFLWRDFFPEFDTVGTSPSVKSSLGKVWTLAERMRGGQEPANLSSSLRISSYALNLRNLGMSVERSKFACDE